jgi:hypothetical protein
MAAPNGDSSSEWRNGNCASKIAFASMLQGAGTRPKERLIPKDIATIIVPTPTVKSV